MSVDMFSTRNNDILQCILYEWLDIQDICQLDIAVCNHSIRPLYYEALQTSTLPLLQSSIDDLFGEVSEKKLFDLIKWSKIRGIKNPIETIRLRQIESDDHDNEILTSERIYELSNDLKPFKYIKSLSLGYCNSNLLYAFGSLKSLTYLQLNYLKIVSNDFCLLGFFFKQLTSLERISILSCSFDPILISFLSDKPSLISLEIKEFDISNIFINEISKLTQLETLLLNLYDDNKYLDLSYVSTFSRLTELSLKKCKISLQHILSLNQLKKLELSNIDILESNNINYENYLPFYQLESFIAKITNITPNFMQFILKSILLKIFTFDNYYNLQSYIFYEIGNLSQLIQLTLRNINVDNKLFDNLCKLSHLKFLFLVRDSNQINKQNICLPFSKLSKQLTSLDFRYQPIIKNKNTFEEISQLHNLTQLSFDYDFTKSLEEFQELQPLSQLKQLTRFSIMNKTLTHSREELKKKIKEILQNSDLYIFICCL